MTNLHVITDGGTKHWVACADLVDNAAKFKAVDGA